MISFKDLEINNVYSFLMNREFSLFYVKNITKKNVNTMFIKYHKNKFDIYDETLNLNEFNHPSLIFKRHEKTDFKNIIKMLFNPQGFV